MQQEASSHSDSPGALKVPLETTSLILPGFEKETRQLHGPIPSLRHVAKVLTEESTFLAGSIFMLVASALLLKEPSDHNIKMGALSLIGFGSWSIGCLFSVIGLIRSPEKFSWVVKCASGSEMVATICLVMGSMFWLSTEGGVKLAGEITWIGGSSLLTFSHAIKILAFMKSKTEISQNTCSSFTQILCAFDFRDVFLDS
jgi:hypothetical protein